jgi:cyclopropane fatty-acyl-phospholipid synthase-like methyltransferase
MRSSPREFAHLRAYMRASRELSDWMSGARVFALLSGAAESGVLDVLRTRSTPEQLAAATSLDEKSVVDLCLALEAHGVVRRDGDGYELTPHFALLASPTAALPLTHVIRQAATMIRAFQTIDPSDTAYTALRSEDVLAMAEGAGISALSSAPHVTAEATGQMLPEVEALWKAGARHLEVGCGVGNALFGTITTYPQVTAVGIEIDEPTAAEAERRAGLLGLTDRVEVRRMDACELQDESAFDTIQWSQFFFPTPIRPAVLQAMHRALKPGGYLFMPWLGSVSSDTSPRRGKMLQMTLRALRSGGLSFVPFLLDVLGDTPGRRRYERRFSALQRLLFSRWGVPVRTLSELESELEHSGFRVVRTTRTPTSQFVLTRGLVLARREPV